MPFLFKWEASRIALFSEPLSLVEGERSLMGECKLDFELAPEVLSAAEPRQQFREILDKLRSDSGVEVLSIDLVVPAHWGASLTLPPPGLAGEELTSHLRWELAHAVLDPLEQYRYGFMSAGGEQIRADLLRQSLFDQIQQICREAGYELHGLFLGGAEAGQINLIEASQTIPDKSVPQAPYAEKKMKRKPAQSPARAAGKQQSWFFVILLLTGLALVVLFAWMKLTSERKPGRTAQLGAPDSTISADTSRYIPAAPESLGTTGADTSAGEQAASRTIGRAVVSGRPAENPPVIAMSCRMPLVQQFFAGLDRSRFDLLSLTGDRFIFNMPATDSITFAETFHQLEGLAGVKDLTSKLAAGEQGVLRGTIRGKIDAELTAPAAQLPDSARVIGLGIKHGLKQKALVFTGGAEGTLNFLQEISAGDFQIYRLNITPEPNGALRTVIYF